MVNPENADTESEDAGIEPEDSAEPDAKPASSRLADSGVTIEGLKAGLDDYWRILVEQFGFIAKHYVAAQFSTGSTPITFHDAEDITMVLIGEIYTKIGTFNDLNHLEAHFRESLRHDAIDLKRKFKAGIHGGGKVHSLGDPEILRNKPPLEELRFQTNEALEDDAGKADEDHFKYETPASLLEIKDLRILIFECAATLKPRDREIIQMVYNDRKEAETAKAIDVSTNDVGTMLSRIYKKLRRKITARMGLKELRDYGIATT